MLKEIQQANQHLIDHIEAKLSELRLQRRFIQSTNLNTFAEPEIRFAQSKLPNDARGVDPEKLAQLEQLYKGKKQLDMIGLNIRDPSDIHKYYNDKKWVAFRQKKTRQAAKQDEKQKIIREQMAKTKQFLASKKSTANQLKSVQTMNYRSLLKNRIDFLAKYEELVEKSSLNRLQKQQLISMAFDIIKEGSRTADRTRVKSFLLANPEFCLHFRISHEQINRDLQVYQTKDRSVLDQTQFTEFVKSIQITNLHIKPRMGNKQRQRGQPASIEGEVGNEKNQALSERQIHRKHVDFLRRVFKNLDRANQGIVYRQKFIAALEKGLYLDSARDSCVKKEALQQLAYLITGKTKQKIDKNYYKQLDSKFINFNQIQQSYMQMKSGKREASSNQICMPQVARQHSINLASSPTDQQEEPDSSGTDTDTEGQQSRQADNQKTQGHCFIGPGLSGSQQGDPKSRITQLDKYYKEVRNKYEDEIRGREFEYYRPNFEQLEAFIKLQENVKQNGMPKSLHQKHKKGDEKS